MNGPEDELTSSEPDYIDSLTEEEVIERLELMGFESAGASPALKESVMADHKRGIGSLDLQDFEIIL